MSIALLVVICIGTGITIRVLRRLPRLVFVASLVGAALLGAILATAPSAPIDFVGRTLMLDTAARACLWLALGIAVALAFFGPLTFGGPGDSPSAVIVNAQGAFFFWSLAPLAIAITLDSFPLAIFFWAIGLIALMLLAQPQRAGHAGGAAQFLLITVIAAACLLLANRFLELYPLTPENLDLIRNAVIFLALGLGLLLAVAPLHIWLGPLADEMPVLGTAFLVGVAQSVGLWLLFQRMSQFQWLTNRSPLLTVLLLGGALTVLIGALLTLAEWRDGRLVAYLSLVALGHALIGLGLGTRLGLAAAVLAMSNRAVGIALVAGGITFARHHAERRWQIVGALAILCGGLTLTGIAPALGFATRWTIYRDLVSANLAWLALLFASNAAVLLATLRIVWQLLAERTEPSDSGEVKIVPYLCTAVVMLLITAAVVTGIFPQLISDPLVAVLGKASYLK
jgi:formate hydrogenlyase subunit 3/multisubunit Na+/H+ antiporter MnhD subunit